MQSRGYCIHIVLSANQGGLAPNILKFWGASALLPPFVPTTMVLLPPYQFLFALSLYLSLELPPLVSQILPITDQYHKHQYHCIENVVAELCNTSVIVKSFLNSNKCSIACVILYVVTLVCCFLKNKLTQYYYEF